MALATPAVAMAMQIDPEGRRRLLTIRADGRLRGLIVGMMAICSGCSGPPSEMALSIGPHSFQVEVAATPKSMKKGLSQHDSLPENRGMLFVLPRVNSQCMWMRDTHVPLSAAFLGADGRILNIARMWPDSLELHCSVEPAKYVLEMNAGWFAERGIRARSRVSGLP